MALKHLFTTFVIVGDEVKHHLCKTLEIPLQSADWRTADIKDMGLRKSLNFRHKCRLFGCNKRPFKKARGGGKRLDYAKC
ncbi:hypothetical protein AMECASPLE_035589 [Ameca splendens]|uniref:Uncharacterized protein n=1 Tax=Ameca splendens TaxID=208324 RepID=A0ABV1A447_9TELE